MVRAKGGNGNTSAQCGGGGGGRIAIWVTGDDAFSGSVIAPGGLGGNVTGYGVQNGATGTVVRGIGYYVPGMPTLSVSSVPTAHGTSTPFAHDTCYVFSAPQIVTNTVNSPADESGGQRFVLLGWTATTGAVTVASGSTTQAVFTVTGDTVQTWFWTNQFYLALSAGSGGSLVEDKSGWYTNGLSVQVQAQPDGGYRFVSWIGDVPPIEATNNPLTLTMNQARTVQALFSHDEMPMARTWNGNGLWTTASNWTPAGIPGPQDDLTVASGRLIINSPVSSKSLTIQSGARVVFTNWNSTLSAEEVTLNAGATVTVANAFTDTQMSNNVSFAVSNFTLQAGSVIDVSALGYAGGTPTNEAGSGPGGASGRTAGGSYGGPGGNGVSGARSPYGSVIEPIAAGSGGGGHISPTGWGGHGGGAVRILATGTVRLDGTILANGGDYWGTYGGGGSGGSIYITANTFAGTSGVLRADGGNGNLNNTDQVGGGGGGRIALVCNPAAQASAGAPSLRISANRGKANRMGSVGTVYLTSALLMPTVFINDGGVFSGFNVWSVTNPVFSNAWMTLSATDLTVSVAGDLGVQGVSRIELGAGPSLTVNGHLWLQKASNLVYGSLTLSDPGRLVMTGFSTIAISQNVSLGSNTEWYITASATNTVAPTTGTLVAIAGTLSLSNNAWIYPQCATNGDYVVFKASAVLVGATNSGFNAQGRGWPGSPAFNTAPAESAHGPGRGRYLGGSKGGSGGGYGGVGGGYTLTGVGPTYSGTYGDSNAPALPGSGGGGGDYPGGAGGGLIYIVAEETVTLNGVLNADGGANTASQWQGGGSGGGIYIRCRVFRGTGGVLRAKGGTGGTNNQTGAGGGGRIAVWRVRDESTAITTNVDPGDGGNLNDKAAGTVVWGTLPPRGTVIVIR